MPIKDQAKTADLMAAMNDEFRKLFPNDSPDSLKVDKSLLTAVSLLRGDIAVAVKQASRATLTGQDYDRIAKYNPRDPE